MSANHLKVYPSQESYRTNRCLLTLLLLSVIFGGKKESFWKFIKFDAWIFVWQFQENFAKVLGLNCYTKIDVKFCAFLRRNGLFFSFKSESVKIN